MHGGRLIRTATVIVSVSALTAGVDHIRAPAAHGEPANIVVDLGTLPGASSSNAVAINDNGVVIGSSDQYPVRWDRHGRITALELPARYDRTQPIALNDRGVIIGWSLRSEPGSHSFHAVRWNADGRLAGLELPFGTRASSVVAINNDGVMVGWASAPLGDVVLRWTADGAMTVLPAPPEWVYVRPVGIADDGTVIASAQVSGRNRAVRWDRLGNHSVLDTIGNWSSHPAGVDDYGVAVGSVDAGGEASVAVRWDRRGRLRVLPTPSGVRARATGVNRGGTAIGTWHDASDQANVCRWDSDGTMTDLPPPPSSYVTQVVDVNDSGDAVGTAYDGGPAGQRGVLWDRSGRVFELGTLGGVGTWIRDINNAGLIVGTTTTDTQHTRAALWPTITIAGRGT